MSIPPNPGLSIGTTITLLDDPQRRAAITILHDRGSTTLEDLAARITTELDNTTQKAIEIELHQNHLPVLERAGAISTTRNDNTVSIAPTTKTIAYLNDTIDLLSA